MNTGKLPMDDVLLTEEDQKLVTTYINSPTGDPAKAIVEKLFRLSLTMNHLLEQQLEENERLRAAVEEYEERRQSTSTEARTILSENERITKECSRYHVSTLDLGRRLVAEEAKTKMLREELKQVKKENERLTGRIMQHRKALGYAIAYVVEDDPEIKNHEADTIRSELDQVKIERDAWKKSSKDQFSELFMLQHELSQFESK